LIGGVLVVLVVAVGITVRVISTSAQPFTVVHAEDFTGSALDPAQWAVYSGQSKHTQWNPANCVVGGGMLTLRAQPDGSTCGIASRTNMTYGAFEVRARFPAPAAPQFDTTFIAWPQDDSAWRNAEIDYVEEQDPTRQSITGFVHCTACSGGQLEAGPMPLDMTQWHTYRLEWTPGSLRFLVDGNAWFTTTDKAAISSLPHHATVQTDYTADDHTPILTTTQVDWVKIYKYNGQ
jgi:licheninase